MLTAAASAVIQVDKQMSKLEKAAAEGTVELLALTKPGKTTLPYKMTGTYIYMDEMGALKVRGHTMSFCFVYEMAQRPRPRCIVV